MKRYVLHSGSWNSTSQFYQLSYRDDFPPNLCNYVLGFRLIKTFKQ